MKNSRLALLCAFFLAFSQAPAAAPPGPGAGLERAGASLAQGLRLLGLSPAEVTAGFGTATPGESGNRGENLGGLVDSAARLELELSSLPRSPAGVENCLAWSRKFLNLKEIIPRETGTSPAGRERMRQAAASLDSVLPGAGESFTMLVAAERLFHLAFGSLDPVERDELESLVRGFSFQEDQWPGSPVERMCRLAQRVDLAYLWAAAGMCCSAAEGLRQLNPAQTPEFRAGAGWLRSPFRLDTPWGEVIVGTRGRDKYTGTPFLIIDPGGDDSYRLGPDSRGGRKVSMIVDFSGSDTYSGSEGFTPAGSVSGVCWLEDLGGDDRYEGGRFSLGAAALGVGVLVDRLGRDSYVGLELSQGMSFFGLGMLVDLGGDDSYEVSFCGQGACVGGGMGLLMDLDGNDTYTAGGLYPDWRECRGGEPVHTKSYAQGAAGGLRPFLAGGTALLLDCAGNDSYRAGYFGQGAGYWGGTGMLFDLAGDDSYQAARYGQGCGLHRAKGILADFRGDDCYTVGGVGQGAGEDRAYGLLLEGAGADTYSTGWMARGAGGAGGVGLLLELGGDDRYGKARKAVDGFGSRSRELSGLGFLIDCCGDDLYEGKKKEGLIRRSGAWGAGVDMPVGSRN